MSSNTEISHSSPGRGSVSSEKKWGIGDQVNDLPSGGASLFDESDDTVSFHDFGGDKVIDAQSETAGADRFLLEERGSEDSPWDLTPGPQNKSTDLVRLYLWQMGQFPLLTREGEVAIGKRIERGRWKVSKALSRSPIVIKEIIHLGVQLVVDLKQSFDFLDRLNSFL